MIFKLNNIEMGALGQKFSQLEMQQTSFESQLTEFIGVVPQEDIYKSLKLTKSHRSLIQALDVPKLIQQKEKK